MNPMAEGGELVLVCVSLRGIEPVGVEPFGRVVVFFGHVRHNVGDPNVRAFDGVTS